ncbi:MAG: hypothetical protein ACOX4H_00135 [Bacillota bacterium]
MVTDEMKEIINETREKMKTDPEFFWKGPIVDTEGNVRVAEGEQLTQDELLNMNWWVKGIITSMKSKQ